MANPFVKAWKYLMALFDSKIEEHADPKVQIQQAIEEAQRQHQALSQQAASVIGNQRQLEMKLNRQLDEVEKLNANARQAVMLADQAASAGDTDKAIQYTNAAEAFAAQLVTAEQAVEDLKVLHDQSLQAAAQAKKAVEQNAMLLQQKVGERTKLLSQLEQAKMQEQVSASLQRMDSTLSAPGSTPSLDAVREKIERRYANALGAAELAGNSVQGRMMEVQQASVQMAGHSRARADPRLDARRRPARGRCGTPGSLAARGAAADQPEPGDTATAVGRQLAADVRRVRGAMARSRAGDESAFRRARARWKEPAAASDSLAAQAFPQAGTQASPGPAAQETPPVAPESAGRTPRQGSAGRTVDPESVRRGAERSRDRAVHDPGSREHRFGADQRSGHSEARGASSHSSGPRADPAAPPPGEANRRPPREWAARRVRDALSEYGVVGADIDRARRLPDAVREVGEHALHAVRTWAEPREREMRRRRRARRRSLRWGAASGVTAAGTAGLAILAAPVWAVVIVGGGAVVLVTGAAMSTRRYLELRRNPLPQAAFVPRKLPPVRSLAREPMARLVRAEEAFHALITQIARGGRLPDEDLADTLETAASSAAALHALAADLVALEKTAGIVSRGSAIDLSAQVRAGTARLTAGVAEYEHLVAAASRILAAPEPFTTPTNFDLDLLNLRDCADRLDGWAQALADLA